ncbi:MAG: hypothetical protein QOE33_3629, partial [Acidobacteriota bacterium]|nr:hypothetical protein [Acidobacteriota bacterium]
MSLVYIVVGSAEANVGVIRGKAVYYSNAYVGQKMA